ncbi:hypothetical protein VOM14_18705 [Paraburkholderia sp. MPAMCS5]|uniref:hypothetical protein n=1 Tax=Paraburkholderia sp. MPAMCS5 TaxID=3112563 RepID=UPI002E19C2CB|nr:hypothetical protein [Paraburkholderia sp. MPAMCS5]
MSNAESGRRSSNRIRAFVPMSWDWFLKQAKRMRVLVGKDVISSAHAQELLAKVFDYKDAHELYKLMASGESPLTVWDRELSQPQANSRRSNQVAAIVDNLGVTEAAAVAILDEANFTDRLPIPKGTKPQTRSGADRTSAVFETESTSLRNTGNRVEPSRLKDREGAADFLGDTPARTAPLETSVTVVYRKQRTLCAKAGE